jgi:flagellar basal-body rod protein FlgC
MDYSSIFQVSAAGMRVEKLRLDVTAMNIANINVSRSEAGGLFKPLKVVAHSASAMGTGGFDAALLQAADWAGLQGGLPQASVVTQDVAPRRVHDPGHPDADAQGHVLYPGVDHLGEMINMVSALRAYEANVVAMNAARTMATRALEIGGGA